MKTVPRIPRRPRPTPLRGRRGLGTVEIVIIIAVLITIALIFRGAILSYATEIIHSVFGDTASVIGDGAGEADPG